MNEFVEKVINYNQNSLKLYRLKLAGKEIIISAYNIEEIQNKYLEEDDLIIEEVGFVTGKIAPGVIIEYEPGYKVMFKEMITNAPFLFYLSLFWVILKAFFTRKG